MSDKFEVTAESADVLETSHLVSEMKNDAESMDSFPVLIDGNIVTFHGISGGYVQNDDYHLVQFRQLKDSPHEVPDKRPRGTYEAHLDMYSWNLTVEDTHVMEGGGEIILSMKVLSYHPHPYSWSEEMDEDVDKRPTRFE